MCPVGRWLVLSCSTRLVHMCQNSSDITDMVLSSEKLPWGQAQVCNTCTYMYSIYVSVYTRCTLHIIITNTISLSLSLCLPPPHTHTHTLQCQKGYVFSLPQTGYVNWYLSIIATQTNNTQVWINLPPI